MASLDENIETLSQRMLRDANLEAESILQDARAKAEEIRKAGKTQAELERKRILERVQEEQERLRGQAVATTQLKARNDTLQFREQLLEQVFEDAHEKIKSVRQYSNYERIAIALFKEALQKLKGYPVVVRIDPTIQKLIPEERFQQIAGEMGAVITGFAILEQGTGVIVETADGHLNYDNTLETRLSRLQNALRAPVFHILMGEQV